MSGLRIGVVGACPFPTQQGTQVYLRGLCDGLADLGHRVTLFTYHFGEAGRGTRAEVRRIQGVPGYTKVRAGPHALKPALDMQLAALLRGALRRGDLDVLSAHNVEGIAVAATARMGLRIPMLSHLHGRMDEELPSYAAGPGGRTIGRALGSTLDAVIPRLGDATAVLTEDAAHWLRARLGSRRRVHVLPPGLDPADVVTPWRPPAGPPTVLYLGNPDRYQEPDVLLRAMAAVCALHPDVTLSLAGASTFGPWVEQGRALGLDPGRVRQLETRSWEEARRVTASAQLAVVPRGRSAGFPMKVLSLVGLGIPTVGCTGSVPLSLRPFVPTARDGDSAGLAALIRAALADPELRCSRAAEGRRYVLAHENWRLRAAAVAKALEEISCAV